MMEPLRIAFLSDIHLTQSRMRTLFFSLALRNIGTNKPGYGLFVSAGDTTDHGYKEHWIAARQCMEKYPPAPECIIAMGNHDTWNKSPKGVSRYDTSLPLYTDFRRRFCSIDDTRPYFTKTVGGVPFIMLSTEGDGVDGIVSDEQVEWFSHELGKAAEKNTFIFVISHWALKGTHGLPKTFGDKRYNEFTGSIGTQSDRIANIIAGYKNVIYISGHSHMGWTPSENGLGYASFEWEGENIRINLPCYIFFSHGGVRIEPGLGLEALVTDNDVTFKLKNYAFNYIINKYTVHIKK